MREQVMVLSSKDRDALGIVRTIPFLKAAQDGDNIWLRGITPDCMDIKIQQLPSKSTFSVDDDGNLFRDGCITPTDRLSNMEWLPLTEFLPIALPTCAMPATSGSRSAIKLVAADHGEKGIAVVTKFSIWESYALNALSIRLDRLRFAVSEDQEAFIIGTPLPSIPGQELWMCDNIFLPCGYDFEIPITAALFHSRMNADQQSIILFQENGTWRRIRKDCFVPATRSAVRLTRKNFDDE